MYGCGSCSPHTHARARAHAPTRIRAHAHTRTRTHPRTHTHTRAPMHAHTYTHASARAHTHPGLRILFHLGDASSRVCAVPAYPTANECAMSRGRKSVFWLDVQVPEKESERSTQGDHMTPPAGMGMPWSRTAPRPTARARHRPNLRQTRFYRPGRGPPPAASGRLRGNRLGPPGTGVRGADGSRCTARSLRSPRRYA